MHRILILLLILPSLLLSQEDHKTISGVVLDGLTKEPIIGASVYVDTKMIGNNTEVEGVMEGSMIGAATDIDGSFSFEAPSYVKYITVTYIGFATEQVDVSERHSGLTVYIQEASETFEEVVITGYQQIEKRKVTSSYAKVNTAEIERAGVASVDQMLSGQIAGVVVQPTNGAPGSPAKIQIRGTSTLNGSSDPLWVLDGIPLEGNDIPKDFTDKDNIDNLQSYAIAGLSPNDIESITVLKDASATSIYGARAANGVIVITTKKGKKGAMKINASASTFVTQRPDFSKLNLMDANQKVDFELYLASRTDLNYQSDRGQVARILNAYDEYTNFQKNGFQSISSEAQQAINRLRSTNTNWGKELYRTALNQQYSLGISGGSDHHNYYVSAGYFDENGTTKGTGLNRVNVTLKNNFTLHERLKVGVSLFANRNNSSSYITGVDAYTNPSYYSRRANPYLKVRDENGRYVYDPDLIERSDLNLKYNYLEEKNNTDYQLTAYSVKPIFDISYRINNELKLYSQVGTQFDFNSSEKVGQEESYFTRKYQRRSIYTDGQGGYSYFMPDGGIIQNWDDNTFQYNWKTTANYNAAFSDIHELDVMVGTEFRRNKRTGIHTKGFGFNPNTLTTVPITNPRAEGLASFQTYRKTVLENAFTSFFGTSSYTYDGRYTLFGSLRFDGSNLFGVDPKYRYLPLWSLALSWNVMEESFMNTDGFVNTLKLRTSYGVQGNIDKSTSPFVVGEYRDESVLPGKSEEIIRVISAPNKNLRWEKTVSANVGFDLGIWNNNVFITGDVYYRKSTDLIGLRSMPLESGFNFINTNWATISNRGFELFVNTRNVTTDDFSWTTSFNIAHNKNIVDNIEIRKNSLTPSLKGYSVDAVFALKTAGFDGNGLPIFLKDGKQMSAVDFYKLSEGVNGSQLSTEEHRKLYTYVGNGSPLFSGGLTNRFSYKQFTLQVAANYNLVQTVKQQPRYHLTKVDPGKNYSTVILDAGKGNLPALIGGRTQGFDTDLVYAWYHSFDDGRTYNDLDIWVKKMSYIRINSIKLGYSFSKAFLEKYKVSNLTFNIEGRNLFVLGSNYDGYFDPETFGSNYAQPIPKMVSLGFNLSF